MGCRNLASNWQSMVYEGGRWNSQWGLEPTYIGPSREIVEQGIVENSDTGLDEWIITESGDKCKAVRK